jgi:hypothetical protein
MVTLQIRQADGTAANLLFGPSVFGGAMSVSAFLTAILLSLAARPRLYRASIPGTIGGG